MSKEKINVRKNCIAIPIAIIIGFIGIFGAGCSTDSANPATYESVAKEDVADAADIDEVETGENEKSGVEADTPIDADEAATRKDTEAVAEADKSETTESKEVASPENNPGSEAGTNVEIVIPEYKGSAYAVINNNQPGFTDAEKSNTSPFETYSNLDSKGRCGIAFANICREIMPTEKRGEIGMIKPSGWHTVKYNDLIDGNYLYNRCHLIGYQLAGENANEKNLITGTRYLNVEGMLPFENKVANYVESKGNHVLYRVTPKFNRDNLVANGVQIEAWSVEDGGAGICFNVFCYNVQPGIAINYANGDSALDPAAPQQTAKTGETAPAQSQNQSQEGTQAQTSGTADSGEFRIADNSISEAAYILNTNTKKFHYPSCSSVKNMAEHNKQEFNGARDEVIGMGYDPCGRCHP